MQNEIIVPLEKITIAKSQNYPSNSSADCCGGSPILDTNACCREDEEKKAEGKAGCGCGTTPKQNVKSSCCS